MIIKKTGFTLVELVIVVAIVIILSAISVPIYRNYDREAKLTEGYALLNTILSAQKTYFYNYGCFFNDGVWTKNDATLGINARTNKIFTWFHIGGLYGTGDKRNHYIYIATRLPKDMQRGGNEDLFLEYNIKKGVNLTQVRKSGWENK